MFSTIAENIRSFFQREEELNATPKAVPEAASEIYKPGAGQKIVERPLPQKLPFSPEDLRQALKVPEAKPAQRAVQPMERDITHEIDAFENALQTVHEVEPAKQAPTQKPAPAPVRLQTPVSAADAPFFDEFEQFISREELATDGILEKDVIYRMKEFHRHRQEGKEYYLYSKDVQAAVTRKLAELKGLERDWFEQREQADAIEKSLAIIEHEIETRTTELKGLLQQARQKSRLENPVTQGQEFVLADGRRLSSLLDLKIALKNMPDTVFSHHVTSIKNDFAAWVRGAMNDAALADEMGTIRDKHQLEMFLARAS